MKGHTKPDMVVIMEDAYKQNTVYRPWKDIVAGMAAHKSTTAEEPQSAAHPGQAANR